MTQIDSYRTAISKMLDWEEARPRFAKATAGMDPTLQGRKPDGLPYSPWQLVEHIRFTQHDILDFCRRADYKEPKWPDDYWPKGPVPPSPKAWEESVSSWQQDRDALQQLATDPAIDLLATIPHGTGQTYLRELLLVADHNAYHTGELIVVRRALGAWPPA
ncbi:MAG: DinB family protein [Gemmatimonadota bacterium]